LQHTPDVTVVEVMSADKSDPASREGSLYQAQTHLDAAGRDIEIQEVAADRYSSKQRKAAVNNRRRARGKKGS
jgi:hypothetical protein